MSQEECPVDKVFPHRLTETGNSLMYHRPWMIFQTAAHKKIRDQELRLVVQLPLLELAGQASPLENLVWMKVLPMMVLILSPRMSRHALPENRIPTPSLSILPRKVEHRRSWQPTAERVRGEEPFPLPHS